MVIGSGISVISIFLSSIALTLQSVKAASQDALRTVNNG